jgi:NAD(P)-dependent dehydrogenase (short-subunit alcohol dehydrogenase family)
MRLDAIDAVVTGGSSGLGLAVVNRLVDAGARVVVADLVRSFDIETYEAKGSPVRFVEADITDEGAMNAVYDAVEESGPLRALVHCAGRGGDRARIVDKKGNPGALDTFAEVIRVNLIGTYNVLRLAAARMAHNEVLDEDRGACILTASVAAFDGQIGQTSYTAAKAAIHGITLVAARDLASKQIRVNTIAPGTFDTPLLGRLRSDIRDGLAASVPHPKRLGAPDDFARMALQIIENPYVNGETIRLDGAIRMAAR